nr:MAG TPA: hypothetical protein [Caudoviricetes sp.]
MNDDRQIKNLMCVIAILLIINALFQVLILMR